MEQQARLYILATGLGLSLTICLVMFGLWSRQTDLIRWQADQAADSIFRQLVLTRQWSSEHGGVYTLKKPGELSNPFLADPDITDVNGRVYTLRTPAAMVREISQYAEAGSAVRFGIRSLKPKNPQNAPDPWERQALLSFERGSPAAIEVVRRKEGAVHRFMKPLHTEASCLACHTAQGYRVGDVRGGISITTAYDPVQTALDKTLLGMALVTAALVLFVLALLYFLVWRLVTRLARQTRELEAASETKDRFLGMVAHDLRSPLAVIYGFTNLLLEAEPGLRERETLERISRTADRMLRLVDNLLDVAAIRKGRLDLKPTDVDVSEFLRESATLNEITGRAKGIALEVSCPPDLDRVPFDKERLQHVFDNLLSNAFKFSNRGTTVTLGASRSADSLHLWVQDQGCGVREGEAAGIFQEFNQGSSRPTAGEKSHGLGLAIARRVVEAHGGTIAVTSRSGEGTRFTVTLPLSGSGPSTGGGRRVNGADPTGR
ncbi:MAG: DUF3365 domain-containing protein [Candidatus Riflebacteria bacterium]|nr:DUF3365 domain-containing protein [Candidatus Riflebacteria bacterium]